MTLTLGGLDLPLACIEVSSRDAQIKDIEYPSVDFKDGMDMGKRGRRISVTGRLPDAVAGATKSSDIEDLDESTVADLIDSVTGRTYYACRVVDARTHDRSMACIGGVLTLTVLYTIELESLRDDAE